ncbi:hypothetical protein BDW22DRAFT_264839 [Trametopsis cervina]|nr:hypothetical protein BDW22DRAFT_264839 [Trametopsis cervina]
MTIRTQWAGFTGACTDVHVQQGPTLKFGVAPRAACVFPDRDVSGRKDVSKTILILSTNVGMWITGQCEFHGWVSLELFLTSNPREGDSFASGGSHAEQTASSIPRRQSPRRLARGLCESLPPKCRRTCVFCARPHAPLENISTRKRTPAQMKFLAATCNCGLV